MRPRHAAALSLGLLLAAAVPLPAAAAAVLPSAPSASRPARAAVPRGPVPACGDKAGHDFPIRTRLHGGPGTYRAGGDAATWSVDLTNTTHRTCRNVHPVIVIAGRGRDLTAAQVSLRLADEHGRLRAVPLHTTDEDEIIGVFDKDTTGFTVPAGATVTVAASLAFAAGAPTDRITVSAAAVQRQGGDGGWVGQSAPYRFDVVDGGGTTGDGTGIGALPLVPQLAATGTAGVVARTTLAVGLIAAGAGTVVLVERRRSRKP
ncbi:hypothetical protein [Streptomyces montanisoli]|uniref:Gram-positive cocci surface proteins LPxTG domain-containing protein n=1 Tax=Streptomyces montanisoli TaxID=2798581 RepID=A0A940ME70_9ACTN|nr:hypothetical protein [Streptomyces montanisoli]MBP0461325.1 hypothetical protein [Streptomyces montanisoli]